MGRQRQVEEFAHVVQFVRDNDRCPAQEFLESCTPAMLKKFHGQFRAVGVMGAAYQNHERFRPLGGEGKPLWEFKEHDHRLYCVREVSGRNVRLVLLSGWTKDKKGKGKEESRRVEQAKSLYAEYVDSQQMKVSTKC